MENPFIVLEGEQLSSVIFVQDYLQLDFDGTTVTYYDWPDIILPDSIVSIDNREYRNTLCSLIAKIIHHTTFIENEEFVLSFESGEQIKVDLRNPKGEVIYFRTSDGEWSSI